MFDQQYKSESQYRHHDNNYERKIAVVQTDESLVHDEKRYAYHRSTSRPTSRHPQNHINKDQAYIKSDRFATCSRFTQQFDKQYCVNVKTMTNCRDITSQPYPV